MSHILLSSFFGIAFVGWTIYTIKLIRERRNKKK